MTVPDIPSTEAQPPPTGFFRVTNAEDNSLFGVRASALDMFGEAPSGLGASWLYVNGMTKYVMETTDQLITLINGAG